MTDTTVDTIVVVDCTTGQATERPMTEDEIAIRDADQTALEAQRQADADRAAKVDNARKQVAGYAKTDPKFAALAAVLGIE